MATTKFFTYLSPAKLNLGLKVVGKREDGYHLLKTVFCLINLFDEINLQITDNGIISLIKHQQAWGYHKDLAYLAAKLLQQVSKCPLGVNIKVKKTIPSGSGLGGGSSNAATVLIALNQLWQTKLSLTELLQLARQLGADVPFFVYGKNALATGIGDEFTPLELPEQYFVLIKPEFDIPTQEIFTNLQLDLTQINPQQINEQYLLNSKVNDLQAVATRVYPQLEHILKALQEYGEPRMTGSGSVVYLSFSNQKQAKKVAKNLQRLYNTYLVKSLELSPVYATSF
jgi:4-diphosphocytidyl-2-C-methyl-D-erythritol kinase